MAAEAAAVQGHTLLEIPLVGDLVMEQVQGHMELATVDTEDNTAAAEQQVIGGELILEGVVLERREQSELFGLGIAGHFHQQT